VLDGVRWHIARKRGQSGPSASVLSAVDARRTVERQLGWESRTNFEQLIRLMVDADCQQLSK